MVAATGKDAMVGILSPAPRRICAQRIIQQRRAIRDGWRGPGGSWRLRLSLRSLLRGLDRWRCNWQYGCLGAMRLEDVIHIRHGQSNKQQEAKRDNADDHRISAPPDA